MNRTFSAPGRVNLIGEHTDYTGGFVLPLAIPFSTEATIAPSQDGISHLQSESFDTERTLAPGDRTPARHDWSDYPVGVLRQLQARGIEPPPFSLTLRGNVPLGAGLSSSASVEVATAFALLGHSGVSLAPEEVALLCQRAENDYVGSPCGIMDQFVVTVATEGHAVLINTRALTYELLPMNAGQLAECRIVIANSMIRHSVASGDYGVRRREVEAGQQAIRAAFPEVRDLGGATLEQLEACRSAMPEESLRRCRHIITENARVLQAREAMLQGSADALGRLMTAAHISERDDFQCSTPEIDFLVETAVSLPGCYGARLTGGGFGGCTVNLVQAEQSAPFVEALRSSYRDRYAIDAQLYICEAVDGAFCRARRTLEA